MASRDKVRGGQQRWTALCGTRTMHHGPSGPERRLPWQGHYHFYLKTDKEWADQFKCEEFRESEKAISNRK